jgi:hypothetical protein
MSDEWQRFHWGEGNKYVVEGGKAVILINGVAATAILTFIGNERLPMSRWLFVAIITFALGAFVGVLSRCRRPWPRRLRRRHF